MPGKHMPHWTTSCCSKARCSGDKSPSGASASTVRTSRSVGKSGRHQARRDRLAIQQNHAGAAETFAADRFGAGQEKLVAKHVHEWTQGIAGRYPIFAVDLQSHRHRMLVRTLSLMTVCAKRLRLCARDWEELSRDTIPAPRHRREGAKLRNGAPLFRPHARGRAGGRSIRLPIRASAVPPPRPIRRQRWRS